MTEPVVGLLLAGGRSRRMGGGDKCLLDLAGRPVLDRIIARVRPQVGPMVLNANGDVARFAAFGLPVAVDVVDGFAGPLAGVLTGLEWAEANAPGCAWVASFACDTPFVPADLVARMIDAVAADGADIACARSGGRDHPVFGLWPVRLAAELRRAVVDEAIRKVDVWTARYRLARADFAADPVDPFFNLNSPQDVARAAQLLSVVT
jgi:molybdopterin-guanine dinucleotide biosynthesis protein A